MGTISSGEKSMTDEEILVMDPKTTSYPITPSLKSSQGFSSGMAVHTRRGGYVGSPLWRTAATRW
jgi:hypothetical protein